MSMKRTLLCMLFIAIAFCTTQAQQYLNKGEINVISFNTTNGKKMTLSLNKDKKCLIYRFGTAKNIEFQYPKAIIQNYSDFTLFHYLRGGGIKNEGQDLFNLRFSNQNFTYKIYEEWYAVGNRREIGILITDNNTKKTFTIKANLKTIKGTLSYLINSEILPSNGEEF